MDIRLAITKVGIFFFVYILVLGLPLLLHFQYHLFTHALFLMLVLATAGPHIYSYLRRQAENKLLQQQKKCQHLILQAAKGISRENNIDKLMDISSTIIYKLMGLSSCAVYLMDPNYEDFRLQTAHGIDIESLPGTINKDEPFTDILVKEDKSISYDELLEKEQSLREIIKKEQAEMLVPVVHANKLRALYLLGKKESEDLFSDDDMSVLDIFADHVGYALISCFYMREEADRITKEGHEARRQYLDTMVSTMAHEIDNPNAIARLSFDLIEESVLGSDVSEPTKGKLQQFAKQGAENTERIKNIIKSIEDYSRGGGKDPKSLDIYKILDAYRILRNLIHKRNDETAQVKYREEIEENLPFVIGDKIEVEEILMNYAENAYHAVLRKEERNVTLRIFKKGDKVRIEFEDNGYGLSEKIKRNMFEVPTTSKGSSEGTGLGLYRVRRICDRLGAEYGAESQGRDKGARCWVELRTTDQEPEAEGPSLM